jgi:hypothetical protein
VQQFDFFLIYPFSCSNNVFITSIFVRGLNPCPMTRNKKTHKIIDLFHDVTKEEGLTGHEVKVHSLNRREMPEGDLPVESVSVAFGRHLVLQVRSSPLIDLKHVNFNNIMCSRKPIKVQILSRICSGQLRPGSLDKLMGRIQACHTHAHTNSQQ